MTRTSSGSATAFPEVGLPERLGPPSRLDAAEQQRASDELTNGPRRGVFGPFRPLLHRPPLLRAVAKLGETLRYEGKIDAALREWTICVVAHELANTFEWEMHYPLAAAAGVPASALVAVAAGSPTPSVLSDELALARRATQELLASARLSDATFNDALAQWGEAGLIEFLTLVGYFAMVCWVMNVARTPSSPTI